jgi:NTE family protein
MTKKFKQKKKLGLALGSGGWRGQAHIGVIKALVAAGIRIDFIAGTSAGAMVGGAYAAMGDISQVEKVFKEKINKRSLIYAFSDPRPSWGMFRGGRVTKVFENLVGHHQIEDLPIPFCAISTDLLTGEVVEINDGDLAKAIRASTSIPFVFEPVKYKTHRLIDGGTAVPIPVKTVQQMGAEVVIAVNLYKNIFPVKASKMSSFKSVLKTTQIMMYHLARHSCQVADFVLEPDIREDRGISDPFTGFVSKKGVIEAGEKVTLENIKMIKKLLS